MRISEIQIDRYGPLGGLQEECEDGIKVFHGPNESGKTLLLDALLKLLDPNISSEYQRIQRVEETPSGYVVVETGDGEEKLGDGTTLSNICCTTGEDRRVGIRTQAVQKRAYTIGGICFFAIRRFNVPVKLVRFEIQFVGDLLQVFSRLLDVSLLLVGHVVVRKYEIALLEAEYYVRVECLPTCFSRPALVPNVPADEYRNFDCEK